MRPEPSSIVFLTYSEQDADFAYKLAADLQDLGFDIWQEEFDLKTDARIPEMLERAAILLPVLSSEYNQIQSRWHDISQTASLHSIPILPILLNKGSLPNWEGQKLWLDFGFWRNEFFYYNRFETLITHLNEYVPVYEGLVPDSETHYVNHVVAEIKRYKSLLETISPRSETLPSDKRAIYVKSMWGLTGTFEVLDYPVQDTQPTSTTTYQFHEVMAQHPCFVLVGSSGSGKTITLYRTVLDTLRLRKSNRSEAPLPLMLHLGKWLNDTSFEAFVRANWSLETDPIQMIADGEVLLLLDGLDELGYPSHNKLKAFKEWLNGELPPKQLIVSANRQGCSEINDLELPLVNLKDIDVPRIRQYVFNQLEKSAAEALLKQLIHDKRGEPQEAERLAGNSLFLAIIVALAQDTTLPVSFSQQAPLLAWLSEKMWSVGATNTDISFEDAREALSKFAFAMIEDGTSNYVLYDYALIRIADEAILQAALDSKLLQMQGEMVCFCHTKVRDYFAAYKLMFHESVYTRLMRATFNETGERVYWKWDSIIVLCSGMTSEPDVFVREISLVNPYLALECVQESIDVSEETRTEIVNRLLTFIRSIDPRFLPKIMNNLQTLIHADAMPALLEHLYSSFLYPPYSANAQSTQEDVMMPLRKFGKDTVRVLMDILRGDKWQRRRGAAWALGEIQEHAAVPSLVEALQDENEDVRKEASAALVRIGRKALPRLLRTLNNENEDLRAAIIKILGKIGDPSAVPNLITCLPDTQWPPSEETRICDLAVMALEQIGTEEALTAVDVWRLGGKPYKQQTAEWDKRIHGDGTSIPFENSTIAQMIDALKSEHWEQRRDAVRKLGDTRNEMVIPFLINAIKDEDSQVRWAAVQVLGFYPSQDVVNALIEALQDSDYLVCDTSSHSLAQIGIPALPALMQAATNPSPDVRGVVVEALGKIKDEEAIPVLADALHDSTTPHWEDERICDLAASALKNIGTERALFILEQWKGDQEEYYKLLEEAKISSPLPFDEVAEDAHDPHRLVIIQLLDALHEGNWQSQQTAIRQLRDFARDLQGVHSEENELAISKLSSALADDENQMVRWSAAETLAWIKNDNALPALIEALHDKSWTVRISAVRALSELENRDSVPGIIQALQDNHYLVREAAAETLGKIGDRSAIEPLKIILHDDDTFVRRAAIESLGYLGARSVVPELLLMLQDRDEYIRWATVDALGKLGAPEAIDSLAHLLNDSSQPEWEDKPLCDYVAEVIEKIGTDQATITLEQWRADKS